VLIAAALLLEACGRAAPAPTPTTFESPIGLPNAASDFCLEQGYQLDVRDDGGGQVGTCLFPGGTQCEAWAFYRGECAPGTPKP
jgi:putative hemolysin